MAHVYSFNQSRSAVFVRDNCKVDCNRNPSANAIGRDFIRRLVDEDQPGFIECELIDAFGQQHIFIEKIPVVTGEYLLCSSAYPRPGSFDCEVIAEWVDENGSTASPSGIESNLAAAEFVVPSSQAMGS